MNGTSIGHNIDDQDSTARDAFKHTPLSSETGTIRLLRVLPTLTDDDLVQCEVW